MNPWAERDDEQNKNLDHVKAQTNFRKPLVRDEEAEDPKLSN